MHVRQVAIRNQGWQVQIDFRTFLQWSIQIGGLAVLNGFDRPVQHLHVERIANGLHIAGLLIPEEFSCAPDFEIMGRQYEPGAQVLGVGNGLQTFNCVIGHGLRVGGQEIGIGLVMRTSDTPPELMDLSEAEFVSAIHDYRVGIGYINASLDDRGAYQHVGALVIEVAHDLFQLAFSHLAMTYSDDRLGYQSLYLVRGFFDAADLVMQIIDLPTPHQFPLYSFADQALAMLSDERFD